MTRKLLLYCGILSSLLYIISVVLAPLQWPDYSSTSQTVSELIATDAPTRPLVTALFVAYSLLIYAFGVGVWQSAGGKLALRLAAVGLIGKEVLGLIVTLFFPIHLRGVPVTMSDTLHGILTMVGNLFMLLALGCVAAAFGIRLRIYSIVTMVLLLTGGALAGMDIPKVQANLPTPLMGVWERINIFAYMLWVVVLAVVLLRATAHMGNNRLGSGM